LINQSLKIIGGSMSLPVVVFLTLAFVEVNVHIFADFAVKYFGKKYSVSYGSGGGRYLYSVPDFFLNVSVIWFLLNCIKLILQKNKSLIHKASLLIFTTIFGFIFFYLLATINKFVYALDLVP